MGQSLVSIFQSEAPFVVSFKETELSEEYSSKHQLFATLFKYLRVCLFVYYCVCLSTTASMEFFLALVSVIGTNGAFFSSFHVVKLITFFAEHNDKSTFSSKVCELCPYFLKPWIAHESLRSQSVKLRYTFTGQLLLNSLYCIGFLK